MKRPGLTLEVLAFLLVAIISVASVAALAVLAGGASNTTSTSSSQSSSATTSTVEGLRLGLSVTPAQDYYGSPIIVSISDYNSLTVTNSPAIISAPTVGNTTLSLAPCSQLPLGFAVFEGNYGLNNVSEAAPLVMFQPGVYSCPAEFPIAYFSFSPLSDNVTLYSPQPSGTGTSTAPTPMWTAPDSFTQSFSGYWSGVSGLANEVPNLFLPGVYTVVGGDDFGQLAVVHFSVISLQTTTSSTGQTSSSVSTSTSPSGGTSASAASQYGLELLVSTNATEIASGQSVEVNLTEFNTLPRVNNVSASGNYAVQVALGSCENEYDQPFGIAVYDGHVNPQNVSEGQSVNIFPIVPCPLYIRLVTGYEFQPQSNLAVILPESGATPSPLVGSVVISATYSSRTLPLAPGTYTVVAADEWGALAFLYFQVK